MRRGWTRCGRDLGLLVVRDSMRYDDPVRPALVMADPQDASSQEVFRPLAPDLHSEIADVLANLARFAQQVRFSARLDGEGWGGRVAMKDRYSPLTPPRPG